MSKHLAELKAACRAVPVSDDADKLSEGESHWLLGFPSSAGEGQIALSTPSGLSITISEDSVLEAKKEGSRFLVRVKAGSAAIARYEAATTIRKSTCCCSNKGSASITRQIGAGPANTNTNTNTDPFRCIQCELVWHCEVYHPGGDITKHPVFVCVPYLECENVCSSA